MVKRGIPIPICSMYGIFTYIWAIYGVNGGKYSIHGSYGIEQPPFDVYKYDDEDHVLFLFFWWGGGRLSDHPGGERT